MLRKIRTPPPDSPMAPFAWRLVLSIYGAYVVICLVIIAFHIASLHKQEAYEALVLTLSMLLGWVVLKYLWTGVATNIFGRAPRKQYPFIFWFSVFIVLIMSVIMFYLGSGWFIQPR